MTPFVRIFALVVALSVGALFGTARAETIQITPIIGGPGGSTFSEGCGDDGYLVGIEWTGKKDINEVAAICQKFDRNQAVGPQVRKAFYGTPVARVGGFGLGTATLLCPPNTAVETIGVGVSNVNLVHKFSFACRNPYGHEYTNTAWAAPGMGATKYVQPAGCGADSLAVGLMGRYGALIDGLGLMCRVVPQKPIKSVRPAPSPAPPGPPPAPTGPPLAPRASIAGMWDLVVNGGDHYRVQIITQGDGMAPGGGDAMPIGINGIITNSQGETQYDGGFTALLQPNRQMVFTYNQKNGGHGTCQFTYSADGKTLGGTCVDQDNDTFPWTGGRAQ